jgi:ferredoxin-NADP reductase/uncharacterized protein YcbX
MPYLARINVYPIKSLDGVSVATTKVLPTGALADDRRFAIFDALGQYVNGKRNDRIHQLRSTFDPTTQHLTLSDGAEAPTKTFNVNSERDHLEDWLTEFFAFPVSFRENVAAGFPDDTDSPGPTLISSATLREVASWFNLSLEQTRARFRTNLEIDGVPPFWEDHLYGLRGVTVRFKIGELLFDGVNPCQRCVVPARDPLTGLSVPDFAKKFVEMRRQYLPDWAESSRFNHYYRLAINTRLVEHQPAASLSTGDPITVLGPIGAAAAPAAAAPSRPGKWSGKLRVARIIDAAPSVRTFRLTSTDNGPLPFTYLPGQFLNIEVKIDGTPHRRCYTIASAPTRPDYCELTVKREPAGTVSRHLHDYLQEGMEIGASGPGGRFTFTGEEAEAIMLIGAGVGITPLMSVVRYLTDKQWPGKIELLHSARTEPDIIFADELKALAAKFPNLRVTTTLTQQSNGAWTGERGRISGDLLRRLLPETTNRRLHICGPLEMSDAITKLLHEAGVPPEQIRTEAFGGSLPKSNGSKNGNNGGPVVASVTFADSGKSAPVHHGQTVLDAAAKLGIGIDRGCLAGVCGRCKVRLLSGNAEMEVCDGLTDPDAAAGFVLACQAIPRGNVAVEA